MIIPIRESLNVPNFYSCWAFTYVSRKTSKMSPQMPQLNVAWDLGLFAICWLISEWCQTKWKCIWGHGKMGHRCQSSQLTMGIDWGLLVSEWVIGNNQSACVLFYSCSSPVQCLIFGNVVHYSNTYRCTMPYTCIQVDHTIMHTGMTMWEPNVGKVVKKEEKKIENSVNNFSVASLQLTLAWWLLTVVIYGN